MKPEGAGRKDDTSVPTGSGISQAEKKLLLEARCSTSYLSTRDDQVQTTIEGRRRGLG